jgi:AsmA protein
MKVVLRWVLLIVGGLVAAALIAAGGLAYLVSRIDVRAEVERAVEGATGRDLTIAGDVGVSFWPVLGLHAANATLANVEGGRAPAFLTTDDIRVGVELRPLLDRQVVVNSLVLQHPRIALEVDAEGRPNWVLGPRPGPPTPQPPPSTRPSTPLVDISRTSLREVRIDGGEASFIDARRGAGWVVGDVNLSTAVTSLDAPVHVEGSVRYNDQPIRLRLDLANPNAAMRGQASAIKLNLESELLNAAFDGLTTAASGEVAGAIQASGPSLRRLAAWNGAPLQGGVGLEAFTVSGRIAIGGGRYDFSNAAFTLDRLGGRGDFALSQLRGKPYLSGRLELFDFDLNPYLTGQAPPVAPAAGAAASAPAPNAAPAPTAQIAAVEAPPRALDVQAGPSEAPIDFSGLQAFNADLELATHAVLVQHIRVDAARLNLVINDGYLAATLHNLTLYGGSGSGRFEVDARQPAVRMVQDMAFSGLDAKTFLSDAVNFANIEGRAELSLNLRAQGRTQTEMISGADGRIHLEVVSGVLHGVDLGGVASTIRNALRGELIAPEAATPFQGFSGTFAVADGVLASHDLSFNTTDLRIPAIGVIDLTRRRLDLRLAPRSPRGGLVFPFSIRGPWGQFAYDSDISGRTLREVQARVSEVETAARAAQ